MDEKFEIMELLQKKQLLEQKLGSIVYGSVEIREKDDKKYIYVHYREDGILLTKYVGEYSEEVYNLILNNSIESKKIKKDIKDINKRLKALNYVEEDLDDKIEINIDFAKRHLVDTIYKQAILEGVATTFADTESIIEGGKVNNMTSEDVMKIVNLKHAWEFILNKNVIQSTTNFALLCEINRFVQEGFYYSAGKVRSTPVSITGTDWIPDLPIESVIKEELEEIFNANLNDVDRAIELLLYVMRKQIFIDGNKRTAVIFANHYLISKGKGIIVIPAELADNYKSLLIGYYEGKDNKKIKAFLKDKCYLNI
ncbi:MAG: cell filamentation protein Fic [Lachnospiraceae bacterium]|nr:cell filamentation protein Fic [Lachnospiraceae bacterium]